MINPRKLRNGDPTLLNYAVTLPESASILEQILPVLLVDSNSGFYNVWLGNEERTADIVDIRAPGSPTPEVSRNKASATYNTIERGAKYLVTDEEADEVGSAAASQAATRIVRGKIILGGELRAKAMVTNSANFSTVIASALVWSNPAALIATYIRNAVRGIEQKSGLPANTILIPDNVVDGMFLNTELADLWTPEQKASRTLPSTLMGLNVLTPRSVNNTANIAQTASLGFVWDGTTVEVLHVNPSPSILEPTWGLTFRVRTFGVNGVALESWRDNFRKGDYVEWRRKQGEVITFKEAGSIITGVA